MHSHEWLFKSLVAPASSSFRATNFASVIDHHKLCYGYYNDRVGIKFDDLEIFALEGVLQPSENSYSASLENRMLRKLSSLQLDSPPKTLSTTKEPALRPPKPRGNGPLTIDTDEDEDIEIVPDSEEERCAIPSRPRQPRNLITRVY